MTLPSFVLSAVGPDGPPGVPGSRLVPCSGCGTSRWVAPSSLPFIEQGAPLCCEVCAPIGLVMPTLTEAQRQEIEDALGCPFGWEEYRQRAAALLKRIRRPFGGRDAASVDRIGEWN